MIVNKSVAALSQLRRRRSLAHAISWGAVLLVLLASLLARDLFGPNAYLLSVTAVVVTAGLTGFRNTLLASGCLAAASFATDLAIRSPISDIAIRLAIFLAMVAITTMGAEALRRFHDRTEAATRDLAKSEALTRTLLDTGPDAIVVIDPRGEILRFSRSGEALFGWSAGEVVGQNVSMLMPDPYHSEHDGYISRYRATGDPHAIGRSREVAGRRKDGSEFPMLLHLGEVNIGDSLYFTGFVRDLTALKAANDRAHAVQAELSHLWSMTSLGQMAGVLAHELNQPLSAIANYARAGQKIVLTQDHPDDNLIVALDKVAEQAIRAGEIIRRMRTLVTSNLKDRNRESVSDLIQEIEYMIGLLAKDAGATVRYRLTQGADEAMVDRIQIQQVVMNLVRNAVDAVRHIDTRQICITTRIDASDITVRVEDSGAGLNKNSVGPLFQPMKSKKAAGLGIGLSICRGIIEGHSGSIWVEDSPLGGAAFCFRLPKL